MDNFIFQNPTKLVFGKGMISKLAELIPADKHILITFGGGSVKHNGVYDEVAAALEGRDYIEFWGIEPNPSVETLREAIALGKEHHVDFLLAVGGGSVIDGTKLISAGLRYEGDAWELVKRGSATDTVPLGAVLTLPATGSEMNNGAVISRHETKEKYVFYSNYPRFSILDPEKTFTLPYKQIAAGLADT
ncbi:MAG: iron-containing alcohol dehydrogenase, partial [Alistipes sp.]